MNARSTDVEVMITFLPTEHGGRTGVRSGYRPQFYYGGHDWDAVQHYPDFEEVQPGETVRAYLCFLSPDEHFGKLEPGTVFLIREGNRTVGYGKVTQLLGLEVSARRARELRGSLPKQEIKQEIR